jgi:hypothetical protein
LLTAGRNVAQLLDTRNDHQPRKTLRVVDVVSGEKLFEADYDPSVRMTTLEPDAVAIVEPKGRFQLVNVRTGDSLIDESLPLHAAPRAISAMRSGTQLLVCINGPTEQLLSRPIGVDYPLVDGQVYAFDLRDGRMMWPGPAVIEQRGIALAQPADIALVVFVDRLLKRDANGAGAKLRLLCLDRQTGATVYRNDELPDTSGSSFRIRAVREESPAVNIDMSTKTVRLTFTDRPRSPEPPANDLVEAPRKSLGRGLWGVGRRMGSVIQGVIQDPAGTNWPLRVSEPAGAPAEEQLDDD